ncbi:hypothetical protein SAMN05877753_102760 [Bacillus oleivorans]|uniref:Uncharacterized protein n=1 Tax=Bacillus oleivorans TaxID=1448271 RepID=A0A285CMS6_9BACI|nr:hypothetical protein SAMN05877753_102760 [Bacillus oleivorans]
MHHSKLRRGIALLGVLFSILTLFGDSSYYRYSLFILIVSFIILIIITKEVYINSLLMIIVLLTVHLIFFIRNFGHLTLILF